MRTRLKSMIQINAGIETVLATLYCITDVIYFANDCNGKNDRSKTKSN